MPERKQIKKQPSKKKEEVAQAPAEQTTDSAAGQKVLKSTDDILEAIDEVLEGLDQDLARNYVQVGGE